MPGNIGEFLEGVDLARAGRGTCRLSWVHPMKPKAKNINKINDNHIWSKKEISNN